MANEDPLAALSAAAKRTSATATPATTPLRRPAPAQKKSHLLPILIGISVLALVGGATTVAVLKLNAKEKPPATPKQQPGELFPGVKGQ
jgi:hypothetical protein